MRKKTGGRIKGTPNLVTGKIKDRIAGIIEETLDTIDIASFSKSERIKLLQVLLQYNIPKLQAQSIEMHDQLEPLNIQVEIIDRLDKYKDRDLDKAITG